MEVDGNITSFKGRGLNISNDTRMFQLHDDFLTFNLTDLILDFDLGYEFCSNPAIVGDLGFLNFTLDNFDLIFNMTSNYKDSNLSLNVSDVSVSIQEVDLTFDGLNDFIYIVGGFVNKIIGIVFARIKSILEDKIENVVPLLNKLLDAVPNVIAIPGSELLLNLGFSGNVVVREKDYISIPLAISLQSTNASNTYNDTNNATFSAFNGTGYEIEMAIS